MRNRQRGFGFLSILTPPKMKHLRREFGDRSFRLLDVGAGNHSSSQPKRWLPNCEYYSIDLSLDYSKDEHDFVKGFWEMDLTQLEFDSIPENFFNALVMNHVIEHLHNGDEVLARLINKLMLGGIVFVEFPSFRSTQLPSMYGTLNFFDDSTHCRIYSLR